MKRKALLIVLCCITAFAHSQDRYLITLNQLQERVRNGGDTTFVINFWATWCVPCLKELPHFETLQKTFKQERLKVLLVSVDFKSELNSAVIPFIKKQRLKSEVFLLDEGSQQDFIDRIDVSWSGAIPATLFVRGAKRRFFEKEFVFSALAAEYQNFKQ